MIERSVSSADPSLTQLSAANEPVALGQLSFGDHSCLLYDTLEQQLHATATFLSVGLQTKERCVFVANPEKTALLRGRLTEIGFDTEELEARGALVLSSEQDFLLNGEFLAGRMIQFLQNGIDEALRRKFRGLRATGDMMWQSPDVAQHPSLIAYEAILDQFFDGKPLVGLCQYQRSAFQPDVVENAFRTHRTVVLNERFCPKNVFYTPPEVLLARDAEALQCKRVEWMTAQVQRLAAAETAQRELLDEHRKQREFLRQLLDSSPLAIAVVEADTCQITLANAGFSAITGTAAPRFEELPADFCARVMPLMKQASQSRESAKLRDLAVIAPESGRERWWDVECVALNIQTARPAVLLLCWEVTARRQAEEETAEQRAVLDTALDAAEMGTWRYRFSSNLCEFSPRAQRLYGLSGPHFIHDRVGVTKLIHPDDIPGMWAAVARACDPRGDGRYQVEYRVRNLDGGWRWLTAWGLTQFDASSDERRPVTLAGASRDITQRKHAEIMLDTQKKSLEMVVSGTPLGDVLAYLARAVEDLGEGAVASLLLLDETGALRNGASPGLPADYLNAIDGIKADPGVGTCAAAAALGSVIITRDIEHDEKWKAFKHLPLALGLKAAWSQPIISGSGRVLGTLGTYFRECREPSALEREVVEILSRTAALAIERHRSEEALKLTDRRKDEFLAMLAHELRNPLAPIRNASMILKLKGSADPKLVRARDVIERQVLHLIRLIDDLLDVSRITRGKFVLRKERVSLATVLEQAVETSRPHIDLGMHEFKLNLPAQPVHLHADPIRLAQVFANLLNNASKYTDRGGAITVSAAREGEFAAVRFKDTGIGISAEHLPKLFELFSQVDTSRLRSQGGLGIGLALARGLVEMHGGSIEARSEGERKGSEFIVRLPVTDGGEAAAASMADESTPTQTALMARNGARVLVVDDNTDSAESLALLLQLEHYEVQLAHDGEQALKLAARDHYDVVLLDIGLPKLNGYDVCSAIRREPWGKAMVIIALTGWGTEADRKRSSAAGFDAHLVKPVDIEQLARLLHRLAGRTEQHAKQSRGEPAPPIIRS